MYCIWTPCIPQIAVIQKQAAALRAAKKPPKKKTPKKKEDNFNHQRAEVLKRLAAHEATTAPRRQAFIAHHFPKHFSTFVPAKVASRLDLEQRRPYVQVSFCFLLTRCPSAHGVMQCCVFEKGNSPATRLAFTARRFLAVTNRRFCPPNYSSGFEARLCPGQLHFLRSSTF